MFFLVSAVDVLELVVVVVAVLIVGDGVVVIDDGGDVAVAVVDVVVVVVNDCSQACFPVLDLFCPCLAHGRPSPVICKLFSGTLAGPISCALTSLLNYFGLTAYFPSRIHRQCLITMVRPNS